MNKNYIEQHTRDWRLLKSQDAVELYSYFDSVDWATRYCIKVHGTIAIEIRSEINPFMVFDISCKTMGYGSPELEW